MKTKGPGKRRHIVADTLLQTMDSIHVADTLLQTMDSIHVADTLLPKQMFPRLPARATFVADTKNVSNFVQKHFVSVTNVS